MSSTVKGSLNFSCTAASSPWTARMLHLTFSIPRIERADRFKGAANPDTA
jgi:hypothetical protein